MSHPPKPWLVLPLLLLLAAGGAAAQPLAYTKSTEHVAMAGDEESVDVYRPALRPSAGVAIVAHGFTRSRIRHRDLGRALAEAGVTAVIPDLPSVVDHWANGEAILALAQVLETGRFATLAVERSHLVLIGTSAGGLATILAAAKLPGLAGWIGLDPVDRTGSGTDAAAELSAPAVVLLGSASTCNLFNSGREIARALSHPVRTMAMKGASHCDFEDPTTNLCRVLCGGSSPEMKARIRDETVRATLELLKLAAAGSGAASGVDMPDVGPEGGEPAGPPEPDTRSDVAPTTGPHDPDD
jgi:dienelactone hydrolase